jgi:hypothetical protein
MQLPAAHHDISARRKDLHFAVAIRQFTKPPPLHANYTSYFMLCKGEDRRLGFAVILAVPTMYYPGR